MGTVSPRLMSIQDENFQIYKNPCIDINGVGLVNISTYERGSGTELIHESRTYSTPPTLPYMTERANHSTV